VPLTTAMITIDRVKSPQRRCMGLFLAGRAIVLVLKSPGGATTSGRVIKFVNASSTESFTGTKLFSTMNLNEFMVGVLRLRCEE